MEACLQCHWLMNKENDFRLIPTTRHPKRQRLWRVSEAGQKPLELSATKPLPKESLSSIIDNKDKSLPGGL